MNKLFESRLSRPLNITTIVIDNIYENPHNVREYALAQKYMTHPYHPGVRTNEIVQPEMYDYIKEVFLSYNLDIVEIKNHFQYNLADEWTWIHHDASISNAQKSYAGIIYLTPNAPICGGTNTFKYIDGTMNSADAELLKNKSNIMLDNRDLTKWTTVNMSGNIFNRLIIYDSSNYHSSNEYFGNDIQDARLMQLMFIYVNPITR